MSHIQLCFSQSKLKKRLCSFMALVLVCCSHATGKIVPAQENEPGSEPCEVTFISFADKREFPEAPVDVVTTTGSAISVGGNAKWDYGFVIIEPCNDYYIDKVYVVNDETEQEFELSTLEAVRGNIAREDIPTGAEAIYEKDGNLPAIYFDRPCYLNICGQKLYISMAKEGVENQVIEVQINADEQSLPEYYNVSPGDRFDIFTYPALKKLLTEENIEPSDLKVDVSAINSTPNDAVIKDEESGLYLAQKTGIVKFSMECKKNGKRFNIQFHITMEDGPLKEEDISLSSGASLGNWENEMGMYSVYPSDPDTVAFTELTMTFALPEGAEIVWDETLITNSEYKLQENGTIIYNPNYYRTEYFEMSVSHTTTQDGRQQFTFQSDYALRDSFNLTISYNEKKYLYTFMISHKGEISMSMVGGSQTFYIAPYKKDNIFSYVKISGNNQEADKKKFLEYVTSGKYEVIIPGAELVFSGDKFNGDIIFYYPESYLSVYDKDLRMVVMSGDMDVKCIMSTAIKSGASLNLATLMNGHWDDDEYNVVLEENGYTNLFTYDEETHTLTAPVNNTGAVIKQKIILNNSNDMYMGEFRITVCPENQYEEALKDVVTEIQDNESLVIDMQNPDPVISSDVVAALKDDKKESYLVIKNTNSNNKKEAEWRFSSKEISSNAKKDLKLNVTVNETDVSGIDAILEEEKADGIKVGFGDNGELPGQASVRIYLTEDEVAQLTSKEGIHLYYYNPEKGKMELEDTNLSIQRDKNQGGKQYIEINVKHNSDFVLSTATDLESAVAPTPNPTVAPTATAVPTTVPTATPPIVPIVPPMVVPTATPTVTPTVTPTITPTITPITTPTTVPTAIPTATPTSGPSDQIDGITKQDGQIEITSSIFKQQTKINKDTMSTTMVLTKEQKEYLESGEQDSITLTLDCDENELKKKFQDNSAVKKYKITVNSNGYSDFENATYVIPKNVVAALKEADIDTTISVSGSTKNIIKIKAEQMQKVKEDIGLTLSIENTSDKAVNVELADKENNSVLASLAFDVSSISDDYVYIYKLDKETGKYVEVPNFKKKVSKNGMVWLIAESNENYMVVKERQQENVTRLVDTVSLKTPKSLKVGSKGQMNVVLPEELSLVKQFNKSGDPYGTEEVKVKYSVNDKSIAVIDSNGKLSAKKAGKVKVTVTVQLENGQKKTFTKTITISE